MPSGAGDAVTALRRAGGTTSIEPLPSAMAGVVPGLCRVVKRVLRAVEMQSDLISGGYQQGLKSRETRVQMRRPLPSEHGKEGPHRQPAPLPRGKETLVLVSREKQSQTSRVCCGGEVSPREEEVKFW
jgi:hypothetical protein